MADEKRELAWEKWKPDFDVSANQRSNKDMAEKIRTMKDYYDRYFPNRDKNCPHCFCRKSWFSNTAKCCHCKKEIKL